MTDRLSIDQINSDQLDALYERVEFYEAAHARVLAAVDGFCREPHPTHDHVCPDDVRTAVRAAIERSSP